MISQENHLGRVQISKGYLEDLVRYTVANSFGVTRLEPVRLRQMLRDSLRIKSNGDNGRGVIVRLADDKKSIDIDIYLSGSYGTNIAAVCDSVVEKVRYTVEEATAGIAITVGQVNIYVASIKS